MPGRGLADPAHLEAVACHRAGHVPRDESHARGRGVEPDPPWVTGNEGLGERDQPGTAGCGLADERDHFVHTRGQIQPGGFGLNSGNTHGLLHRWPPALPWRYWPTRYASSPGPDSTALPPFLPRSPSLSSPPPAP